MQGAWPRLRFSEQSKPERIELHLSSGLAEGKTPGLCAVEVGPERPNRDPTRLVLDPGSGTRGRERESEGDPKNTCRLICAGGCRRCKISGHQDKRQPMMQRDPRAKQLFFVTICGSYMICMMYMPFYKFSFVFPNTDHREGQETSKLHQALVCWGSLCQVFHAFCSNSPFRTRRPTDRGIGLVRGKLDDGCE